MEILRFRLALSVDVDVDAAVDEHPFCLENEELSLDFVHKLMFFNYL